VPSARRGGRRGLGILTRGGGDGQHDAVGGRGRGCVVLVAIAVSAAALLGAPPGGVPRRGVLQLLQSARHRGTDENLGHLVGVDLLGVSVLVEHAEVSRAGVVRLHDAREGAVPRERLPHRPPHQRLHPSSARATPPHLPRVWGERGEASAAADRARGPGARRDRRRRAVGDREGPRIWGQRGEGEEGEGQEEGAGEEEEDDSRVALYLSRSHSSGWGVESCYYYYQSFRLVLCTPWSCRRMEWSRELGGKNVSNNMGSAVL